MRATVPKSFYVENLFLKKLIFYQLNFLLLLPPVNLCENTTALLAGIYFVIQIQAVYIFSLIILSTLVCLIDFLYQTIYIS